MRLLKASLSDFRNLAEVRLSFSPGVNLLLGANGHGKTNVLEALNYPALARSFRGARDDELVRFEAPACHLSVEMEDEDGAPVALSVGIERGGRRRVEVDGEPVPRRIDLVGRLATVVFDPQTVELVRGGPENRRRWLDQGISSVDRAYLADLQAYGRVLRQKASLLRDLRRGRATLHGVRDDLAAWNSELVKYAVPIRRARVDWLSRTAVAGSEIQAELGGPETELQLTYSQAVPEAEKGASGDDFAAVFPAVLDYIMQDEIRRGRCLAGPHADDVAITLDGVDLRKFGSRGETRTAAIALKLAQAEVVYRMRRVRPVLFFDDIFSELDVDRSRRLQERTVAEHQVFIATARPEDVAGWRPDSLRTWTVHEGVIEEES